MIPTRYLGLAGLFSILNVGRCQGRSTFHHERATNDTTSSTGDSHCVTLMCISATVTDSTVEYVLQSSGSKNLGWMAMGFGSTMANSPMVIMWANSDSSITLSQRMATSEATPTVVANPPRVANLSSSLSSTTGTQPKFVYTIAANSDTLQNVIWAFGTTVPSSSSTDADLQQHLDSGTFELDLTKAITSNSTSTTSSTTSSGIPLSYYQKLVVAHAILCAVGFLLILPAGALFARYVRTLTSMWFKAHMILQWFIAGPIITAGVSLGIAAVAKSGSQHLNDTHKKYGIAIFILYIAQLALGAIIHWIKPKGSRRRPLQNYLHAIIGLLLIALAFYQVRVGYKVEWPAQTGRDPLPRAVDIVWYVWVVLLPVLYFAGLALLPRQFKQEQAYKAPRRSDMVQHLSRA